MGSAAGERKSGQARAAALALLVGLWACGCATSGPQKVSGEAEAVMKPAAEGWSGHALMLPEASPVVAAARPRELITALDGAWRWVVAQPAMFGDEGERLVGFLEAQRGRLTDERGRDPLTPETWTALGIDIEREVYVGLYPSTDPASETFLGILDDVVRGRLEAQRPVDPGVRVGAQDMLDADEPLAIHGALSRELMGVDPLVGLRVVVPVLDGDIFARALDKFVVDTSFELVPAPDGPWKSARLYLSDDSSLDAVLTRSWGDVTTVDVLFDEVGARSVGVGRQAIRRAQLDRVARVLDAFPAGRPTAPRPPGQPTASIASDHEGVASHVLLRGVQQALSRARAVGIDQRDAGFLVDLLGAYSRADTWAAASSTLTGVTYQVSTEQPDTILRAGVTLVGHLPDEPLRVARAALPLGLPSRSMASSLDLRRLSDPRWSAWLAEDEPLEWLRAIDSFSGEPGLLALTLPRNAALMVVSGHKIFEDVLPKWLEPLYRQRRGLRRLEVGTVGVASGSLRIKPRLVGVLSLDAALGTDQIEEVSAGAATLLAHLAGADRPVPALAPNRLAPLSPPSETAVHYYFRRTADEAPYIFFTIGLDEDQARSEHHRLEHGWTSDDARLGAVRSESFALLALLTRWDASLLDPLDVGILAQRLGALSFEISASSTARAQRLRYDIILEAPPAILDAEDDAAP